MTSHELSPALDNWVRRATPYRPKGWHPVPAPMIDRSVLIVGDVLGTMRFPGRWWDAEKEGVFVGHSRGYAILEYDGEYLLPIPPSCLEIRACPTHPNLDPWQFLCGYLEGLDIYVEQQDRTLGKTSEDRIPNAHNRGVSMAIQDSARGMSILRRYEPYMEVVRKGQRLNPDEWGAPPTPEERPPCRVLLPEDVEGDLGTAADGRLQSAAKQSLTKVDIESAYASHQLVIAR